MKKYIQAFVKTLTASDVDPKVSNQHELHGVKKLESIFCVIARQDEKKHRFSASLRIGNQGKVIPVDITWYNSRASDASRHEYRLYYSAGSQPIMHTLNAGDDIFIGKDSLGNIDIIVFPNRASGYSGWVPAPI